MQQDHRTLRLVLRTSVVLIGLQATSLAQFSVALPFVGSHQEGFETQDTSNNAFPTCVEDRVFTGNADLCSSSAAAHITGGWGFGCSMQEHSGSRLFGCTGGAGVFTFDTSALRFGGYFGTNNPSASHGTIDFYDDAGAVLHTDLITAPNDCTWTWNGWDFGGALVKRIEVKSNYGSGGYMLMDSLEAELLPGPVGTSFCFCDGSANPAPCGNGGVSGKGCANSFHSGGAMLVASGYPSVGANSLVLRGIDTVPAWQGVFFQGDVSLNNGMGQILGDGLRCVGGNLRRLEVVTANTNGESNSSVDLSTVHGNVVAPGETKYYQLWYRDSGSGPCSSTYNLTNALEISWLP
jgi:hypothetical protein